MILGSGRNLKGRLLVFDALEMGFREFKIAEKSEVPDVRRAPNDHKLIDYYEFCGVRGEEAPAPDLQVPEITPRELKARLDRGDDLFILDVREPHEYQICNLQGTFDSTGRIAEAGARAGFFAGNRGTLPERETFGGSDRFSAQGRVQKDTEFKGRYSRLGRTKWMRRCRSIEISIPMNLKNGLAKHDLPAYPSVMILMPRKALQICCCCMCCAYVSSGGAGRLEL